MPHIRTVILASGDRKIIPLAKDDTLIDINFQIDIRRILPGQKYYPGTDRPDGTPSPQLKVRGVHGDPNSLHKVTRAGSVSKNKIIAERNRAVADVVKEDDINDEAKVREYQTPENQQFDLDNDITTLSIKNIYASAILIDDEAAGENNGSLLVTIVS